MKHGITQIPGKTISSVISAEHARLQRLFIIFDDDTHLELYSEGHFDCTKAVDKGGRELICHMLQRDEISYQEFT